MVGKRINKFWFTAKIILLSLLIYSSVLYICRRDFVEDEYCEALRCESQQEASSLSSTWDDFVATFCMYPDCD